MYQKINITLPQQTLYMIEQVTAKKNRSKFIDEAVKYYMEHFQKIKISERLKQGAIKRAERDIQLSNEWNELEDNLW